MKTIRVTATEKLRVDQKTFEVLKAIADLKGMTVNEYVNWLVLKRMEKS